MPYEFGTELRDVLLADQSKGYPFWITYDWVWLEPWGWGRVLDLIISTGLAFLGQLLTYLQSLINLSQFIDILWELSGNFNTVPQVDFTHIPVADAINPAEPTFLVSAWTRKEKVICLVLSISEGGAAGPLTAKGFVLLFGGPWTAWMAPFFFLAEAILWVQSQLLYVQAVDPDPNYTELFSPQAWEPPPLGDSAHTSIGEFAQTSSALPPLAEAATVSYARYLGALEDGDEYWAAIQLSAASFYVQEQLRITEEMHTLSLQFIDSLPPTDPAILPTIRDSIAQHGMPEIEEQVLQDWGFDQEGIDSLLQFCLDADDSIYVSYTQVPGMLADIASNLESGVENILDAPVSALMADITNDPSTMVIDALSPLTCYCEFHGVDNLTDYQILTATVNDSVDATDISQIPGDYDGDGIDDLALAFDLTPLALPVGVHLLSVAGNIVTPESDTSMYAGAATITVIKYVCGDVNGDTNGPNIVDLTYLVEYLFGSGDPPPIPEAADMDGPPYDGVINIVDLTYLVSYLFGGGPEPDCG